MRYFFWYWLPPIILMVIIFALSSRQRISVSDEFTLNFLFFKTLHVIEYATLYFLLFRAFYSLKNKIFLHNAMMYAFIGAVLYGCSDEIHQTFVPTREGTVRDVFIDTIGIFFMYIYIRASIKKGRHSFIEKFL